VILGAFAAGDPSQLLPAREQMAFTLGFHIVLVPFGVAFTTLMMIANWRAIRRDDDRALTLAKRWSKVAAVLFAVGAVSGTVLSFELGLLWPGLMGRFGAAYGIPFAVEGIFFFLEAIFIAIYIYGWDRMRPWPHFWTGLPVVLAGIGGTLSVVAANAWMNLPGGFSLGSDGRVADVDPFAVIFNRAFSYESIHMLLAAYAVAGFMVASVYAVAHLRGRTDRYHRLGFLVPFTVAAIVMPFQIFTGDLAAREVYDKEPVKFATIEALAQTADHVPETIGGVYKDGQIHRGIKVPDLASMLAGYSPDTKIQGLDATPADLRPPDRLVTVVHLSFDAMVFIGFALLGLSGWFGFVWWRRRDVPTNRWFLRAASVAGILAVVALELGWVVTEVGRQPWTVVGYLLTRDAVTTSGNVWVLLATTLVIYAVLGVATVLVIRAMQRRWDQAGGDTMAVPYGPHHAQPLEAAVPERPRR
jgi:cytochrome d ubiquinol oxidase subunit I